ncbi:MAG TPA: YfiR family protein [Woeseiaceae bacterium]|nr:YfiR family protein [Woeseiaceae bacterium]
MPRPFLPRRLVALAAMLAVSWNAPAAAQSAVYSAQRVKAAFLYHFCTYVTWPESATSDDVFTIAVLGADAVAEELEEFLPGHTIQGRPMEVRRLRSITDLKGDEVLYIGRRQNRRLRRYVHAVAWLPVLVVTDVPDGLREGAIINFRIVQNRVRFEISLRAAQRAGLALSSRLLSAAMSVESTGAVAITADSLVAGNP